jgi:hypothetical protein
MMNLRSIGGKRTETRESNSDRIHIIACKRCNYEECAEVIFQQGHDTEKVGVVGGDGLQAGDATAQLVESARRYLVQMRELPPKL